MYTDNPGLAEIIDIPAIQSLMEHFYALVRIPMSIIDLKGRLLVGVGWQDVCMNFHRANPETGTHCIESDTQLTAGVAPGKFRMYKCKNNMWDIATPIMVDGRHVGNLFSGQFFFEDESLDYPFFRAQAKKYGFDEEAYIDALERVPRLSRKTLDTGMAFFMELATMISKLGHGNLELARTLAERRKAEEALKRAHDELEVRVRERTSELHAVAEALKIEQQRLRDVLDVLPAYVVLLTKDHHVPFANRFFRERFGDSGGKRCYEYLFQRSEPCEVCDSFIALQTGAPHRWEWTGPDNRIYDIYDFPFTGADGTTFILEMGLDITERKQAEAELKLNEARLAQAQRIAHLGHWDLDTRTNELYWSDEVYSIFGLDPKTFIPTYETFLNRIHPEDREKVIKAVGEAIREKNQYTIEHRIVLPDGSIRFVNEQGEVSVDLNGTVARMVGTVLDISPLKLLEQKRMEAIQIAERASHLASIGEVAGGITHEINQPLNAIKVTIDGILLWNRNNAGLVPEQFISMLGKISASADRISNIIKHMRAFWVKPDTRVEEVFNLGDVVTRALSLVTGQLSAHGIKTKVILSEPPSYITGNPLHIEQIVINLVRNAMNSLDTVSRREKTLLVQTRRSTGAVQLTVQDNGTGIPEGAGEMLFDPFFSTSRPGEGMGLGLAIVKRFVEEHKGNIMYENIPSGGAAFTIHFPVSPAARVTDNEHPAC